MTLLQRLRITSLPISMLVASVAGAQPSPAQVKAMMDRENLPAPSLAVREFQGVYEADVPAEVGIPGPTVKLVLECTDSACTVSLPDGTERYPNPGAPRQGLFDRTRMSIAKRFPGAKLLGCINLAGDAMPDGPFACKLTDMPRGHVSVLLVPPGPPGEEIPLYPRVR